MGWFSEACSLVGSVASTVWDGVKSVASTVWDGVKKVASEALDFMSERAETFINNVATVWEKIKPLIRPALQAFREWAPWPWLKAVATGLEKALDWVEKFENSELAKKLKQAFEWVAKTAKFIKEKFLTKEEVQEAQDREEVFRQAKTNMPADERKSVELAELINKFMIVQSLIQQTFKDDKIQDFDHYLRLRATQKLLAMSEKTLEESQNIENVGDDEIFLISISADLMQENPTISNEDIHKLNNLVYKKFHKELIPFVFEEMIIAWSRDLTDCKRKWEVGNKALAKDDVRLKTLINTAKLSSITHEEEAELNKLKESVASLRQAQDNLSKSNRAMENYVYAAEGLLEVLEGNAFLDDKEYLIEQVGVVGKIIIDCAQNGKKWEVLTDDEQELIIDFANIFKKQSLERASQLVEVAA